MSNISNFDNTTMSIAWSQSLPGSIFSLCCNDWPNGLTYSIFQNQGTPFLSCLGDATRRLAFSCFVLLCLVWPNINHSHACLWLLATLVLIGLDSVFKEYHTCAKFEMDMQIHWTFMILWKLPKTQTRQDEARPGKTRQDDAAPRQDCVPWFWKILYVSFIFITIQS